MLTLVAPLVADQNDQPGEEEDPEDFAEEQGMMGRLVQLLQADDADQQYLVRTILWSFGRAVVVQDPPPPPPLTQDPP